MNIHQGHWFIIITHWKKNQPKEAYYPWKGPYTVVHKYSNSVYRIQKGPKSSPLVVNDDKLKPANTREKVNTDWVKQYSECTKTVLCSPGQSDTETKSETETKKL